MVLEGVAETLARDITAAVRAHGRHWRLDSL
jgi:hypothetical protein